MSDAANRIPASGIITISAHRGSTSLVSRTSAGVPLASRACKGWVDARLGLADFARQEYGGACRVRLSGDNAWTVSPAA